MCLQCLSTYHMRTWSVFQVYKSIITTHQCVYNVCQLITWQHELCVSRFTTLYSQSINVFTMFVNLSSTWSVCFKVYNSIIISHKCVYLVCQLIMRTWSVFQGIIATHKCVFVNLSSDNMKCVLQGLQFYNHNPSMCLQCLSTYHLTTWSVCLRFTTL